MTRTGILLVNLGSPTNAQEMKTFLYNMFSDVAILPFPTIPRKALAFVISNLRFRNSWRKYELIGGSPLKTSMNAICEALQTELGNNFEVLAAYSYSQPSFKQGLDTFNKQGIKTVKIIPLLPHSSISTTGSVERDFGKLKRNYPDVDLQILKPFPTNKNFIAYWVELVQVAISRSKFIYPTLLFSAHAIPAYQLPLGDTYVDEINASAQAIASTLGLNHQVAFQSKIGRVEWVGPDTKDCLKNMHSKGIDEIILVPISFINENLETLYDQDIEIIPYANNELGIKHITRAHIPHSHPLLIDTLKDLLEES